MDNKQPVYLDDDAKSTIPGRWCQVGHTWATVPVNHTWTTVPSRPYLDDGVKNHTWTTVPSRPYLDDGAKSTIPGRWREKPYVDDDAKSAIPGRWCQVGCEVYCLSHSAHPLTLSVCLGHNRTLIGSYDLMALYKSVYYYYYYYYCSMWGGSVAEWSACWTQAQKGLG